MTITTVGIDLAKNVFAVHGVDQNGKTVLIKSRVTRTALPGLMLVCHPVLSEWRPVPERITGQDCSGCMVMNRV